jgi:hypothetical protein
MNEDYDYEERNISVVIWDIINTVNQSIDDILKARTTSRTYPLSFVTQIFHSSQPSHGGDRKTFEVMPST